MKLRTCKNCGQQFYQYQTTQNLCNDCAYQKSKQHSGRYRVKSPKPAGKIKTEWHTVTRPQWFKNHPPNDHGYYECYLGISKECKRFMLPQSTTLDHVIPRSNNPAKRNKQQNLRPACWNCNTLKGSRSLAFIIRDYPNSKVANAIL